MGMHPLALLTLAYLRIEQNTPEEMTAKIRSDLEALELWGPWDLRAKSLQATANSHSQGQIAMQDGPASLGRALADFRSNGFGRSGAGAGATTQAYLARANNIVKNISPYLS